MAEAEMEAPSSPKAPLPSHDASNNNDQTKPLLVRVKRKRVQEPIHSLWLEVIERPSKRLQEHFASISLNHTSSSIASISEQTSGKLLFRHLETVTCFGAKDAKRVDSLLKKVGGEKPLQERWKEQWQTVSSSKVKQEHLLSTARERQKSFSRTARFEQVWRKRRELDMETKTDHMHEFFNLYDIVRVDNEEEYGESSSRHQQAKRESQFLGDQILCNYLPLLREYLPEAVSEIESMSSSENNKDEYVYDVYGLQEDTNEQDDDQMEYPIVQVMNNDDFYWGESAESEYDSEDSNDENNPLNDYPEESDLESQSDVEKDETDQEDDEIEVSDNLSRDEISETYSDLGLNSDDDRSYW